VALMRLRKLDDHVRHWRRLASEPNAHALRSSLAALDAAMASGNVRAMRQALDDVRREGFALERALRRGTTPS
jgi:hypothetical protein